MDLSSITTKILSMMRGNDKEFLIMDGLNKNGRAKVDYQALKEFDEPGKQLAYRTLRKIFKEPKYSYEIVEMYAYGDIKLLNTETNLTSYIEVECRTGWQHKYNMLSKFADTNITLKNGVSQLQQSGVRGFCISLSMDDLGKPFANEFYITKLSDLSDEFKDFSPNRRNPNEKFFKLLNHQVVKWVYNFESEKYEKQNEYKPREYKVVKENGYTD